MICSLTNSFRRMVVAVTIALLIGAGEDLVRAHTLFSLQQDGNREKALALVEEAITVLEKGDETSARDLFKRATTLDPNNELAHTYLGVIADRSGDLAEAERRFAAAAIAAPVSPAARNNHGAILLRLGRLEQAAKQFEVSLRLKPGQPSALVNLAQIRFASGTPEGLRAARELFEKARAIAPDAEIARSLVVVALRLNDRQSAAGYYQDYASLIGSAPTQLNSAATRAELGAALFGAGLGNEASRELSAAVTSDPSNVEAIILLARSYLAQRDIPSAGRTLESAIARGLEAAPLYAALADLYQVSGHIENAIPAMRLAIERDPRNEAYRFRYGMLLTDTKAPEAAVIRLNESLKEFPRSSKLWFALGVAHFKNHKHDEAAVAFERSAQFDPGFAPALAYLGIIYDETARYEQAIAAYRKAVAVNDNLAAVHYLLADALLRQPSSADLVSAESHLKRAISLEPTFAPARLALGRLYLRTERFNEAATQLEAVAAADPNQPEAQYQLSRVYMRLKRTEDAQKAIAAFKRLSDNQQKQALTERQDLVRRLANVNF